MNQPQPMESFPLADAASMPWKIRIFLLVLFIGPAAYFCHGGDYILAALIALTAISAFSGFRIGATAMFTSVIAITAAIAYAPSIAYPHEFRFTEWFGTTGLLNRIVSVGAVGLAMTVLTSVLAMLVTRGIYRRRPMLDRSNRWLGFWIGGAEGVVLTFLLLGGVLVIEPLEQKRAGQDQRTTNQANQVSTWVLRTADLVHQSELGPYVEKYNPFVQFPELNKIEQVQKSVQVLSDPQKIQRLINHPDVKRLQQRPEVREVVDQVMQDPEIREALSTRGPMNRSIAMTLLNHPAILKLVDQPEFMDAATKVIRGTQVLRP